jgi:hypothetical protein
MHTNEDYYGKPVNWPNPTNDSPAKLGCDWPGVCWWTGVELAPEIDATVKCDTVGCHGQLEGKVKGKEGCRVRGV